MDWTQTITLGVAILGYITAMILFLYHLNEKNIEKLEKGLEKMEERMNKNESHWRELFMYINNKIDEVKKPS